MVTVGRKKSSLKGRDVKQNWAQGGAALFVTCLVEREKRGEKVTMKLLVPRNCR